MTTKTLGIILNGATGRIGSTQHLQHALVPIRDEGGLAVGDDRIVPHVILAGRDPDKLRAVAAEYGVTDWTTDLDAALADPAYPVFFDAAATEQRVSTLNKAIAAGKHVYAEKPVALSVAEGLVLLRAAQAQGVRHGAVEDKVHLPGLRKIARLVEQGFFGRIVSFRLEFGWWVFDGFDETCQRPSWNYRRANGGGLMLDMYPHWRYVIEGIVGRIRRVVGTASTATPERIDEQGQRYAVDVEDTAATLVELENGAIGTILSSWATRPRGDDLVTLRIDGTEGSAVAGMHRCWMQAKSETRLVDFNASKDIAADYRENWREAPQALPFVNPYRVGWEDFIRQVVAGTPMRADFRAGIRDVQLAEACHRSIAEGRWVNLDDITA